MTQLKAVQFDEQEIYCRKLGHHLHFSYCRMESNPLPCAAVKRCWQHRFGIDEFLDAYLSKEEVAQLEEPSMQKMTGILDIIQRVKDNQNTNY